MQKNQAKNRNVGNARSKNLQETRKLKKIVNAEQ